MSAQFPNYMRLQRGELGQHGNFGNGCHIRPVHITASQGHVPHLKAAFDGGLEFDMTPTALLTFIREAEVALKKLPLQYQKTADHVGGDQ